MITGARDCPSCQTTLPADAVFCHRCGTATPQGINRETGQVTAPETDDVVEAARRELIQQALGDSCQVRRLLGRGGFAEVYVAYDKRLKREIAVKTIRGDLVVNETLLERFQREAEAVAKLRHPNVVPIYSVGESHGVAYFTMPLIEGESLGSALEREGRFSVSESVRILREASHALNAAHRAGIVHRDVKPENIMLEGPERSVVVMDFGIAKSSGAESKGLTGTGMLIGTPDYMSPEQAMGEQALDARSDQYALAMIGYRMLAGRVPFQGDSVQTLIFKTVTEVPSPVFELAPDVPRAVSDVIAKALAKRADDRYESMAAFAEALTQGDIASHGAGVLPARSRRRTDLAERTREALAMLPNARVPIAIAVAGCIAASALAIFATPRVPLQLAGSREDAVFAARTFLSARGLSARGQEFTTFTKHDTAFRVLQRQLGFAGMQERAAKDVPVFAWEIRWLSPEARKDWRVTIAPGNRVSGFLEVIPDSVPGARISVDSARVLAAHELVARGWSLLKLEQLPDSTISRKARTDHLLRWNERGAAIPWTGGTDSAHVRVVVRVAGDRVVRYAESLQAPDSYTQARPSGGAVGALVLILFLAGIGITVMLIVKRSAVDMLQWRMVIRFCVFAGLVAVVPLLPQLYEAVVEARIDGSTGPYINFVRDALLGAVFLGACLISVSVVGESLAYATNPASVAGLDDVSHGRLLIPEIVPAAVYGYACGALFWLADAIGPALSLRGGLGAPNAPSLPFSRLPFLTEPLQSVSMSIALAGLLLFLVAAFQHTRFVARVAVLIPATMAGLFLYSSGGSGTGVAAGVIGVFVLSVAIARYGVLAGFVAMLVSMTGGHAVTLLFAEDAQYLVAGVTLLAVFALPGLLAFVVHRRQAKKLSTLAG